MWILRAYLLAGLLIHKAVWEILKRRSGRRRAAPGGMALRLVKGTKVAILVGLVVQTLLPMEILPIREDPWALRTIGTVIYTVGLSVAILARLQLGRNWSDIETPQIAASQVVVSRGLYRSIRHPVYLGDLMLLLGLELALNSWLVFGAIALIPIVSRRAIREEKLLAERLPGYDAYMRRTKRFIPFVV
jgi:protein-S-isoprenylcysteine O-methyltransferase Ste14